MAASLADIQSSAFYPLTLRHALQALPVDAAKATSLENPMKGTIACNCTSVLALVASTNASQKERINEKGTTVTTHGVIDLLADDGRQYTLTAHCTTDTHMDFMLTPPKRFPQHVALIMICGILEDDKIIIGAEQPVRNFLVESVLPLHAQAANVAH